MSDIATDIAIYLDTQGYGEFKNANPALNTIFIDELQDQPDNQIAIFVGSTRQPERFSCGSVIEWPAVDIQVRNLSKATARSKAEEIRRLLDDNEVIPNTDWSLGDLSRPEYLGKTGNTYRYVVSFEVSVLR